MELMDISLDKFYKFIYSTLGSSIPEDILGKITVAVSRSEPPHDKTNKMTVCPAKTQISLGILPV